jgi:phosphoglucosamine mutase
MSRKHFGTDGIRGIANRDLTPELAFRVGRAAGVWLLARGGPSRVVLGRDTRRSGPMLGASLASGFCASGVDVVALGVAPTPAVAFAAREPEFSLGVVLSASHNPAPDNGIKLIGPTGSKLPDEDELEIERLMDKPPEGRPEGIAVGFLQSDRSALTAYLEFLESLVPERLAGMKVALDGSHGAAFELAPQILARLGAEVVATGVEPDGTNINLGCGATHPSTMQELTASSGADIGVAFDGDADRAVFSDEKGRLINGDRTIGIWSGHWRQNGRMRNPVVVGTVMSNGGFESYLLGKGIELKRAAVGDKYVSQLIRESDAQIGGEQSGHIIFPDLGPTGDGLATMLELLRVLLREGRRASSFYDEYEAWPQLLVNVRIGKRDGWNEEPEVAAALASAASALEGRGRLNVRPSGTQPMLRVMVEADDYALRDEVADGLLGVLRERLGGEVYSRVDLTHGLGD